MDFRFPSDLVAFTIAWGYAVGGYALWYCRAQFVAVQRIGWLLFPGLAIWVLFYLLVPFLDERGPMRWVFVWLSRTGHFTAIALLFLVAGFAHRAAANTEEGEGG